MSYVKGIILFILFVCSSFIPDTQAQNIRIMPMGNSITYDSDQADITNPRPIGDRIGYRYKLYQLLTNAGYSFDFTGSEDAGNNYFLNTEMDDNAGFPGITDAGLASLLNTGINPTNSLQVSPGTYMESFPSDIILLHIGTNDVDESPDDVENILNIIRANDPEIIILVARIINRSVYSPITTTFNDNVEAMVAARNDSRIISVDMEDGAGINYLYQMDDNIHPNQTSYDKMAAKWFESITNLNSVPVISEIPEQVTNEGTVFANINLDNYITDNDNSDEQITWNYKQQQDPHVSVTIDVSRILHISPNDSDWNGNDTIRLIAEDSGNGAFIKKDSVEIALKVLPVNDPPFITSTPSEITNEDILYSYTVIAEDIDSENGLMFTASQIPGWLTFDPDLHILSGIPGNDNVGLNAVTIQVSDGSATTYQVISLTVINTNDAPIITTQPVLTVRANDAYLYEIKATDIDLGDELTYLAGSIPEWLHFTAGSTSGVLIGTPAPADAGDHIIVLQVSDGEALTEQEFTITITPQSAIENIDNEIVQQIYPNPVTDKVVFTFSRLSETTIAIYNLTGVLQRLFEPDNVESFTINLDGLPNGTYIYKILQNNKISIGKIIKIDS